MRTRRGLNALLTASLFCFLQASIAATPPTADPQAVIEALTKANAALVGVQVIAAEGARSAETLGKQRMGSGVVIGPDHGQVHGMSRSHSRRVVVDVRALLWSADSF